MGKRLASKKLFFLFDQSLVFSIIRHFHLKKKKKKVCFHPDNREFLGFCAKALQGESEKVKSLQAKTLKNVRK